MVAPYDIPKSADGTPPDNDDRLDFCLRKFYQDFPTEEAALEELFRRSAPNGSQCSNCHKSDVTKYNTNSRAIQCNKCFAITWVTSNSIFRYRKKLLPRLLYITLLENSIEISKKKFARIANVCYDTAHLIFLELTAILEMDMEDGSTSVPSKLFSIIFCKRSRETPARKHPVFEQEEMERAARGRAAKGRSHVDSRTRVQNDSCTHQAGSGRESSDDSDNQPARHSNDEDCFLSEIERKRIHDAIDTTVEATDNGLRIARAAKLLFDSLSDDPEYIGALLERSTLDIGDFLAALLPLEFLGVVEEVRPDRFSRVLPMPKQVGSTENETTEGTPRSCSSSASGKDDEQGTRSISSPLRSKSHFSDRNFERQVTDSVIRSLESLRATGERRPPKRTTLRVIDFLKATRRVFHGTSRKNLQKYVAYWCYINRTLAQEAELLIEKCLQFAPITERELRDYVTQLRVKMTFSDSLP